MVRFTLLIWLIAAGPAMAFESTSERYGSSEATDVADWSGLRAGIHVGLATSAGKSRRAAVSGTLLPYDVSNGLFPASFSEYALGAIGGFSAGYNFQYGRFVLGAEGDLTLTGLRIHHRFSKPDPNPSAPFTGVDTQTTYQTDFSTVATLRLRGGYAFRDTLFYTTAGVAFGRVTNRFTLNLPQLAYSSPGWSTSGMRYGYVIGAGIEHKITERVSLKLESMFVDLQDTTVHAVDSTTFPGETIDYRFGNSFLSGRIGLNISF